MNNKEELELARDFLKKDRAAREKWLSEMQDEDRVQLILTRRRAIENGKLADICFSKVSEYIHCLAAKDPATLTYKDAVFLEKAGKMLKLTSKTWLNGRAKTGQK